MGEQQLKQTNKRSRGRGHQTSFKFLRRFPDAHRRKFDGSPVLKIPGLRHCQINIISSVQSSRASFSKSMMSGKVRVLEAMTSLIRSQRARLKDRRRRGGESRHLNQHECDSFVKYFDQQREITLLLLFKTFHCSFFLIPL